MRKSVLFSILVLSTCSNLWSQPVFYTPFEKGLKDAYQLKFDAVEEDIAAMRAVNESEWRIDYLEHTIRFLTHFVDEDKLAYNEERDALKSRIDRFEETAPKGAPEYYLYLGEMHLEMAALEAKFKHNWGAGSHGMDGLSALQKGQELFPHYKPMSAGMGILNIAIGSVPEDYQFITSMMGYSGDISVGMDYLKEAIESSKDRKYAYLKDKHAFLYGLISEQLFPDEVSSVNDLNAKPEESPLLAFIESNLLKANGMNDDLILLLEEVTENESFYPFPYLHYQLGRAKLARGDEDANVILERYIEINKGVNYIKSTYRYLHWYYRLRNNTSLANRYRDFVLSEGQTSVGADLHAEREMKRREVPIELLKARMDFDHGRFDQTILLLRQIDVEALSPIERVEYYYRKGRAQQELNLERSAVRSYMQARAIEVEDETTFEYVNATLQLGILNEGINSAVAESMFKAVLKFDDYPWKHSTQQKAKAGLSRLNAL